MEDLAQQKLNPFADTINLPATVSFGFGFRPRHDVQLSLTFQPRIPLSLSEDWRLVTRSTVSIIDLPGPDASRSTVRWCTISKLTGALIVETGATRICRFS